MFTTLEEASCGVARGVRASGRSGADGGGRELEVDRDRETDTLPSERLGESARTASSAAPSTLSPPDADRGAGVTGDRAGVATLLAGEHLVISKRAAGSTSPIYPSEALCAAVDSSAAQRGSRWENGDALSVLLVGE
jgi:hypothetical protein